MLNILFKSFMTATRTERRENWSAPAHWKQGERFDNRRDAEIEAHLSGRRT